MKINGKEIDLDLTDLRILNNIEKAKDTCYAAQKEIESEAKAGKINSMLVLIERQCKNIYDFFDTILGAESAENIFDRPYTEGNLKDCLRVFYEFIRNFDTELQAQVQGITETVESNNRQLIPAVSEEPPKAPEGLPPLTAEDYDKMRALLRRVK
jgi:hypothetical protein